MSSHFIKMLAYELQDVTKQNKSIWRRPLRHTIIGKYAGGGAHECNLHQNPTSSMQPVSRRGSVMNPSKLCQFIFQHPIF